jgi:hypothetical protein
MVLHIDRFYNVAEGCLEGNVTDKRVIAAALADCGRHTDHIEELATTQLVRLAGAPDIDRAAIIAALESVVVDAKALRVQLQLLRTELPIH